ncbi:MAG: hypothetical protein H6641_05075 [Caldilineaceae bacterium]|nr:hypothetical protein [Caldilineaceae bacterium]
MITVEQLWRDNPLLMLSLLLLVVQWIHVAWLRLRLRYVQRRLTKAQSHQTPNSLSLPSIERVIEKGVEKLRNTISWISTSWKRVHYSIHESLLR